MAQQTSRAHAGQTKGNPLSRPRRNEKRMRPWPSSHPLSNLAHGKRQGPACHPPTHLPRGWPQRPGPRHTAGRWTKSPVQGMARCAPVITGCALTAAPQQAHEQAHEQQGAPSQPAALGSCTQGGAARHVPSSQRRRNSSCSSNPRTACGV